MDPLENIYKLVTEAHSNDHRAIERDKNGNAGTTVENDEGLHVIFVDEVNLSNGIATPAEVEFDAEWDSGDDNYGHGYSKPKDGFICNLFRFTVPKSVPQEEFDSFYDPEDRGILKIGADITELVPKQEYARVCEYIEGLMNQGAQDARDSHASDEYDRRRDMEDGI